MGHIFEGTKMYTFVISKLAIAHVPVVLDDFANVFWGKILLGRFE
jgi:hypothetical protein